MPTRHPLGQLCAATLAAVAGCGGSATPAPSTPAVGTPASSATLPATVNPTATGGPAATPSLTARPAPALDRLSITTQPFAEIPGSALTFTAPGGAQDRLYVGNREGQIWQIGIDGTVLPDPMIDLSGRITSGGEQGLLGLAAHPATLKSDDRVFVDFTNRDGNTVIASIRGHTSLPNRLDPDTFQTLLVIDQPYPNHNGGSLQFGRDGYLTIAMGDGGSGGDPHGNGQDPDALLGKILRIDVNGTSGSREYRIPAENPSARDGGAPEVWISGVRNPWRTSFDRETGDFWIGDVGQGEWEEVDVVRRSNRGPVNFGWNVTEGPDCYDAASCNRDGLTDPVAVYRHDLGCAIVGGYVYRGAKYPFLVGAYLFSDNCTSTIWAIDAASDGPSTPIEVGAVSGNVASFGEDAAGELYALTLQGAVLKLVASQR